MQRARLCNLVLVTAILSLVVGSFFGCSPQKRHQILTFFFDGVPSPDQRLATDEQGRVISYLHKPYAEGKCDSCHPGSEMEMSIARPVNISDISSSVCLNCHKDVLNAYPRMHGPVAAGVCLQCHAPHESPVPHIMRARAPAVCVKCHQPEMLADRVEHEDLTIDCLSCHTGHGSHKRGMLRAMTEAPTTRPTASEPEMTKPEVTISLGANPL